jgi:hypothetical protein
MGLEGVVFVFRASKERAGSSVVPVRGPVIAHSSSVDEMLVVLVSDVDERVSPHPSKGIATNSENKSILIPVRLIIHPLQRLR